ncbi:MAG: FAD:protein FMN transferase [Planctomycetota bacterium]
MRRCSYQIPLSLAFGLLIAGRFGVAADDDTDTSSSIQTTGLNRFAVSAVWQDKAVVLDFRAAQPVGISDIRREFDRLEVALNPRSAQDAMPLLLNEIIRKAKQPVYAASRVGLVFGPSDGIAEQKRTVLALSRIVTSGAVVDQLRDLLLSVDDEVCAERLRQIAADYSTARAAFRALAVRKLNDAGTPVTDPDWNEIGARLRADKAQDGGVFDDSDRQTYNDVSRTLIFMKACGVFDAAIDQISSSDAEARRLEMVQSLVPHIHQLRRVLDLLDDVRRYGELDARVSEPNAADPSDLVRIADSAPAPVAVDPLTAQLLSSALRLSRETAGDVNPLSGTLYGTVDLYDAKNARARRLLETPKTPQLDPYIIQLAKRRSVNPNAIRAITLWNLPDERSVLPDGEIRFVAPLSEMTAAERDQVKADAAAGKMSVMTSPSGEFIVRKIKSPIEKLLPLMNPDALKINDATVSLSASGARLNVDAFVDGFLVERARLRLAAAGIKNYRITVGSVSYAMGTDSDGLPWSLTLPDPRDPRAISARIAPLNVAVAVIYSPMHRQARGETVRSYLDPKTGVMILENSISVAVSDQPMTAQVWALSLLRYSPISLQVQATNLPFDLHFGVSNSAGLWHFSSRFIDTVRFTPSTSDVNPALNIRASENIIGLVPSVNIVAPAGQAQAPLPGIILWHQYTDAGIADREERTRIYSQMLYSTEGTPK